MHPRHILLCLFLAHAFADLPICKESDYHFEYTECDVLGSRWRVAIPNKAQTCTDLPDPVRGTQCTFSCNEGEFLDMQTQLCQKCAAGTHSLGSGVAFDEWDHLPTGFATFGTNTNGWDVHTDCSNSTWTPMGDYIASNTDECTATLSYSVELKKPGSVSFDYLYSDSSIYFEFYVQNDLCQSTDTTSRWMKISESDWSQHEVQLNKGNNVLFWRTTAYSLHGRIDNAVLLRNIAISGVAYTSECFRCKPGTYSSKPGAARCAPCPADTYSNKGATVCHQCEPDKYAEVSSGSCKLRPACTNSDYFYTHTPCDANGKTQLMYKWIEPKICSETAEGSVKLPASGEKQTCPPCNPGFYMSNTSGTCQACADNFYSNGTACEKCPVGTEAVVGLEYKWWNTMPSNMITSVIRADLDDSVRHTAWEVAGEYVYTTPGDRDTDYLMLRLTVPGYRLLKSLAKDGQQSELSRISFVFETSCSADCTLLFMVGFHRWNHKVVELWKGTNRKQSYSYLIHSNTTVGFTWTFQRTANFTTERRYSTDVAKIFSIHITNVLGGVASHCRQCAPTSHPGDDSTCVPCPPGHLLVSEKGAEGTTGKCQRCPPNSIVAAEWPTGEPTCVACGPNTNNNQAYTECFNDCTAKVQTMSGTLLHYDFSLLSNVTSFQSGPRFTSKGLRYFHHFSVALCGKEGQALATCLDNVTEHGQIVRGRVCQSLVVPSDIRSQNMVASQPFIIGDSLIGVSTDTVLANISSPPWLFPSMSDLPDVIFYYKSTETTQACKGGRSATIRLRCDPTMSATDHISLPSNCSEGTCDGCTFHFLWQSQHACPLCTKHNYRVIVSACEQGIQRTTYVWKQPLQCYGGEALPAQKVNACVTLDFWLKIGVSTGTVAAVLLVTLICYFWKKTRKLEYKYSKLMMSSGGKECELPTADSCAIMEGEDAEDELLHITHKNFFTKMKAYPHERTSDGFDSVPLKSSSSHLQREQEDSDDA
ncbi:endosome/lysosome-associated apoptosis and autophagy regulator 1 [Corythoichthys intestinalis]|uniref:endosome/lysosome-associated apoptosis and autophagy regulator 1 n=1 Tax=Corythoichthys intestinalis TaxID=161448 RepID=UPI0025A57E18|nr:endosome/lysosome-associated apoptosis and autophagy regulator 1 [Corythoichthys intestinalis]XP_061802494.1 endosome/lysosome-associated apoptosis and autophagy regulator 1-like [Nerophis lumbriciformis]